MGTRRFVPLGRTCIRTGGSLLRVVREPTYELDVGHDVDDVRKKSDEGGPDEADVLRLYFLLVVLRVLVRRGFLRPGESGRGGVTPVERKGLVVSSRRRRGGPWSRDVQGRSDE